MTPIQWGVALILALPFLVCVCFAIDQIWFDTHQTEIDE